MQGLLVDSNIILDLITDDPVWAEGSESALGQYYTTHALCINPIIYAEISIGFARIEEVEKIIEESGFTVLPIPREALFLAGKVFLQYRRAKGSKHSPLPDFYIGAHAAVESLPLLTRDTARYRTYFPSVELINPHRGK